MFFSTNNLENIERILERNFVRKNTNKTADISKYENNIFTHRSSTYRVYYGEKCFEMDKPVVVPEGLQKSFRIKYLEYCRSPSCFSGLSEFCGAEYGYNRNGSAPSTDITFDASLNAPANKCSTTKDSPSGPSVYQLGPGTVKFTAALATAGNKKFAVFFFCEDLISELSLRKILGSNDLREIKDEADQTRTMLSALKVMGKI